MMVLTRALFASANNSQNSSSIMRRRAVSHTWAASGPGEGDSSSTKIATNSRPARLGVVSRRQRLAAGWADGASSSESSTYSGGGRRCRHPGPRGCRTLRKRFVSYWPGLWVCQGWTSGPFRRPFDHLSSDMPSSDKRSPAGDWTKEPLPWPR